MSDYDPAAWLTLQYRIEALEEAQVKQATDLVKALSGLAAELRAKGKDADTNRTAADASYYNGRADSYQEVALMVDALSTGSVMQAALDALDARVTE